MIVSNQSGMPQDIIITNKQTGVEKEVTLHRSISEFPEGYEIAEKHIPFYKSFLLVKDDAGKLVSLDWFALDLETRAESSDNVHEPETAEPVATETVEADSEEDFDDDDDEEDQNDKL